MSVFLVDINKEGLAAAESAIKEIQGVGEVHSMTVDVSKVDEVVSLREKVLDEFGEVGHDSHRSGIVPLVKRMMILNHRYCMLYKMADPSQVHVLQNNAGLGRPTPAFSLDRSLQDLQADWDTTLNTNFRGILNVAQAFAPYMCRQENDSVIINTGSKQGITCPP